MTGLTQNGKNYQIGKAIYPRLSTIMENRPNPWIEKWKKKIGEDEAQRISNETSEWGSKVHLITAYSDLNKYKMIEDMLAEDESLLHPLLAWEDWVNKYIKKWVAIEKIVWSNKLKVAGKLDRVGIMRGDKRLSLCDLKTGSLWDDVGIRLYGYRFMWNERNRRKVERCLAIQLPRNEPGELKVKEYSEGNYKEKFIELCEDFHLLNRD